MKNIFLAISFAWFIPALLLGQSQSNYKESVYLKNGSIIRGFITEIVPGESLKVETPDESVFVYQMKDVEKITINRHYTNSDHVVSNNSNGTKSNAAFTRKQTGLMIAAELGGIAGVGNNDGGIAFTAEAGNMFNSKLFWGGGIGYRSQSTSTVPVFTTLRITPVENKVMPEIIAKFGYGFNLEADYLNGVYFAGGFGIRAYYSATSSFLFNITYQGQKAGGYGVVSGVAFSIGFTF